MTLKILNWACGILFIASFTLALIDGEYRLALANFVAGIWFIQAMLLQREIIRLNNIIY